MRLGRPCAPRDADGAEPVLAGRVPADVRRKSRGGGFVGIETHVQRRPSEDDLRPGPVAPTRGRQRKALTQKVAERVRIFGPRSPSRVISLARQFTPMAVIGGELVNAKPPGASHGPTRPPLHHLGGPDGAAAALLAAGGGFGTAVASLIFQVPPSRISTPVQWPSTFIGPVCP